MEHHIKHWTQNSRRAMFEKILGAEHRKFKKLYRQNFPNGYFTPLFAILSTEYFDRTISRQQGVIAIYFSI